MAMMLLGRIVAGFSVGLLSGNAPLYTSEIAPPALRGALVTGFQFAVTETGMQLEMILLCVDPLDEYHKAECRQVLHSYTMLHPQFGSIFVSFLLT